jgi:hypothetical protein
MVLLKKTIKAHQDFEFNANLKREIDYFITIPENNVKGLVVYIAGFGADAGEYRKKFSSYIADKFSMACLTVDYHCFFSRPASGGKINIEPGVLKLLQTLTGCTNNESIDTILAKVSQMNPGRKEPVVIPGLIYPDKNEYQNFGILPALDHIYSINDVLINYPQIPKKIYAIGSSYGGYIANLISKLAPRTLNAVFDNSSWAKPNLNYITGRESGSAEFVLQYSPNILISLNVLSPWSQYLFMPNGFNHDRFIMRAFPRHHLRIMKEIGNLKTVYKFIHAENDLIANTGDKKLLVEDMKREGFDVDFKVYSQKDDIDGEYIKNLSHGMGVSMRRFFDVCYDGIEKNINEETIVDYDFKHRFEFLCQSQKYIVDYEGSKQPRCCLEPLN